MRAVVQRVRSACVHIASSPQTAASDGAAGDSHDEAVERVQMGPGLLCLVAVGHSDGQRQASELAHKLVHLRIFPDEQGRMNRSLLEVGGTLGIVSQFTLYGDTRKGRRPYFGDAARPTDAEPLLNALVEVARSEGAPVITGRFGAMMEVELVNTGPVTLWIDTADWS